MLRLDMFRRSLGIEGEVRRREEEIAPEGGQNVVVGILHGIAISFPVEGGGYAALWGGEEGKEAESYAA